MKVFSCIIIISLMFTNAFAQINPVFSGKFKFSGSRYSRDVSFFKEDLEGNLVLVGWHYQDFQETIIEVSKFSSKGALKWKQWIDNQYGFPFGLEFDDDGNYFIAYVNDVSDSSFQFVKFSPEGEQLFSKSIPLGFRAGLPIRLYKTPGGNLAIFTYVLEGFIRGIKMNFKGEIWQNYSVPAVVSSYDSQQFCIYDFSQDTGYIIFATDAQKYYLAKLDFNGPNSWVKNISNIIPTPLTGLKLNSAPAYDNSGNIYIILDEPYYYNGGLSYLLKINKDTGISWYDKLLLSEDEIFGAVHVRSRNSIIVASTQDSSLVLDEINGLGVLLDRKIIEGRYSANNILEYNDNLILNSNSQIVASQFSSMYLDEISQELTSISADTLVDVDNSLPYYIYGGRKLITTFVSGNGELVTCGILSKFGEMGGPDSVFIRRYKVTATSLSEETNSPLAEEYKLSQNYPNPFNPSTNITFQLESAGNVLLEVYDIMGRKMQTLVNAHKSAGLHSVSFDGSNLSSGVFFYHLIVSDGKGNHVYSNSNKMLLLK